MEEIIIDILLFSLGLLFIGRGVQGLSSKRTRVKGGYITGKEAKDVAILFIIAGLGFLTLMFIGLYQKYFTSL